MLFVQAAMVIMMRPHRWQAFSFGRWLTDAAARMPRSQAAIALANKLARTARSLLRHGIRFDGQRDEAFWGDLISPRAIPEDPREKQHALRPQHLAALVVIKAKAREPINRPVYGTSIWTVLTLEQTAGAPSFGLLLRALATGPAVTCFATRALVAGPFQARDAASAARLRGTRERKHRL